MAYFFLNIIMLRDFYWVFLYKHNEDSLHSQQDVVG